MFRAAVVAVLVAMAAVAAAGCGGGGDNDRPVGRADVRGAGRVVLTVWDEQVRGGQRRQIEELNADFQRRYPNVRIRRVARSTTDLNTSLRLAVSGRDAPDVVQANQGRQVMGELVRDGLLRPLDGYAQAYGWARRWPKVLLDLNRFTSDGSEFGTGSLYGVSQMGEIVGLFYRRDEVPRPPRTLAELEAQLGAAKAAGQLPIAFGNLDGWPAIHEFQSIQAQYVPRDDVRDFVFGRSDATFDTPGTRRAAAVLQSWARRGWLGRGFDGVGYDPAWQRFARGRGRFLIAGTWLTADLAAQGGGRIGFMLVPPLEAGADPSALGGTSLPFAITSRSRHPEVAAAYLDYLTGPEAARVMARTDNLPAVPGAGGVTAGDVLTGDVRAAWRRLVDADGLVPYLDYTTPTAYDTLTQHLARLLEGSEDARAFVGHVEADAAGYRAGG
ncbi:MAG TPA: extracellular solute-binding protein [Solirubrobacteraceae bacterium]|nr:extracellular solute-binding protein [Solirubrobacteraceae bacterium]